MCSQSRLWKYELCWQQKGGGRPWRNRNWLWNNLLILATWNGSSSRSKRWTNSLIHFCVRIFHSSSWNDFLKNNIIPLHIAVAIDCISASVLYFFPHCPCLCEKITVLLFRYWTFCIQNLKKLKRVKAFLFQWDFAIWMPTRDPLERDLEFSYKAAEIQFLTWRKPTRPSHIFLLSRVAFPFV